MDRKIGLLDTDIDEERRKSVQRWLGEKAASFALTETNADAEKRDTFEVRDYQLDAWASLWEAREAGEKRGLVHLATGLGKTSVGVFDAMKFREEQLAQDPPVIPRILFVSHMNDLSEQAHERFNHFMPDLETEFFRTKRRDLPDADITFATFQSLHSELDRFDPQDFEYIIYDEAHHSEADTFSQVRDHFDPLFELALTATPDRMDDRDIREYFGEPVYSKSLAEGIAEGWLADVDYHIVFDDAVKELMEEGFEPKTLKEFHELFKVKPRNEVIAKNIREEQHEIGLDDAKTIVFCEDVDHAEEMAELLDGVAYHSDIKKGRKEILQSFREGDTKIMCTVDMFNEGIDIPDARLLVFLRSTQSSNIFEQQLGRGLRRAPGKDRVSVLDFVANIERIQRVRELSDSIREASDVEFDDDDTTENETTRDSKEGRVDDIDNDSDSGLLLHTAHGEFDFDRMAIDLLEKFGKLSTQAPKGWLSIEEIAGQIGILKQAVANTARVLDIEGMMMIGGNGYMGRHYSPDQFQQIIEEYNKVIVASEDWCTTTGIARKVNKDSGHVRTAAGQLGIEGVLMRSRAGRIGIHYTPEEAARIIDHLNGSIDEEEGWMTLNALSNILPISRPTIQSMLAKMPIESQMMKSPTGGLSPHYPPGTAERLLEEYNKIPSSPEGWTTGSLIAREMKVHVRRLTAAIEKSGVSGTWYRARNGKPSLFYDPLDAEKIRQAIRQEL